MYNKSMDQRNNIRLYIAGGLALILIAVTVVTVLVLSSKESGSSDPSVVESLPSGTVTITDDPFLPEATGTESAPDNDYSSYPLNTVSDCQAVIEAYASDHGIDVFSYPVEIVNLLANNPDALDFVLHYPENAGTQDSPDYPGTIDVSSDYTTLRVPYYYQYDIRWGYKSYAGGIMAMNGSGPTALSMVASYLCGNSDMNPAWMASYAENNNYTMEGGTSWSLMSDGAIGLGIDVTPISADQNRIERNLDVGNIVMCLMGPGDFTDSAQYILIVGYSEEGYEIRDPGSPARSSQIWTFDELAPQMDGCWIMRIL